MNHPLLYIDVDGVVLVRDRSRYGYRVAEYAGQFLTWAVEHFDARWLSTRSQDGNAEEVHRAFRLAGLVATSPTWAAIERIPALRWGTCKAHAIDIQAEFWWLDDNPSQNDLDVLHRFDRLDRLIRISPDDPQALQNAQSALERACGVKPWKPCGPPIGRRTI